MLSRNVNSPLTSSVGRLFDAVASITGLCQVNSYEGQAAAMLEGIIPGEQMEQGYEIPIIDGTADTPQILDWEPMIRGILVENTTGLSTGSISGCFHNALAGAIQKVADAQPIRTIALTGGCFQNAYLSERATHVLESSGYKVLRHIRIPVGDGGISAGQAVIGMANHRGKECE